MEQEKPDRKEQLINPQDIQFWDDDCGLADLAKDAFATLKKPEDNKADKEIG